MTITSRFVATAAVSALLLFGMPSYAAGKLASADKSLLKDIAQANISEVESGKLAVDRSGNAEVKNLPR